MRENGMEIPLNDGNKQVRKKTGKLFHFMSVNSLPVLWGKSRLS